jgi:alpha-acetolactate decarboxylase
VAAAGAGVGPPLAIVYRLGRPRRSRDDQLRSQGLRAAALLLGVVTSFGCTGGGKPPAAANSAPRWDGRVATAGALRAMFHEGMTGATASLDTLLPDSRLDAIGALADLAGEVTVVGGRVWLAYPAGADSARNEVTDRSSAAATLLVSARVPAWRAVPVDSAIAFEAIDARIAALAAAAGLDVETRLPFRVTGTFTDLDFHVVDGRLLQGGGDSHADHLAASTRLHRDAATGTLVGFYSAHDHGVFTHMGSNTHLHVALEEPTASGHVDHVTIPAGAVVHFPVVPAP